MQGQPARKVLLVLLALSARKGLPAKPDLSAHKDPPV